MRQRSPTGVLECCGQFGAKGAGFVVALVAFMYVGYAATAFVTGGQSVHFIVPALGADAAINYRTTDFEEAIKNLSAGSGVNVILDMIGGSYTLRNLRLLAPRGRLVFINYMESGTAGIDIGLIMSKQLTITGSGLRPQTVERKAEIAQKLEQRVWPLIASGKIKPVIDSLYRLQDVGEAHRRMESSAHIGKIVLRMA